VYFCGFLLIKTNYMATTKIIKRDGKIVDFDKNKIKVAMEKAALSVNPQADLRNFDVIAAHAARHIEIKFKDKTPDVESVQDTVEKTLMEFGLFEIAKAYILYRAEHAKLREKSTKQVAQKIQKAKLSYITSAGEKENLSEKMLRQIFIDASTGFEASTDIDLMVKQCEANLYDGISEADLRIALILTARSFIEKDPAYTKVAANLSLHNIYSEVFDNYQKKTLEKDYRKTFIKNLKEAVVNGRLNKEFLDFDLEDLANTLVVERDHLFDFMGVQTIYDKYLLRVEGGERRIEAPQAFWMRIGMGLALSEKKEERTKWAKEFYHASSELRYVPSTPTLLHSGTTYSQLSSCFLNTVPDDLHAIFKTYGDIAQMLKYSGGLATDWSYIRATGAHIKTTNVGSQGVIPFLRIANDVTLSINRSGKRRGASVVYLETWHYDIEDFLDLRRNTGDERRRTHDISTANWIPDLFMKRVNEDGLWTLFSPEEAPELHDLYGRAFEKKYNEYEKKAKQGKLTLTKTIKAKELWRKMLTMLFETGHPWITFKDACNIRSPQDHVGVVHSSNLCTEITLNTSAEETAVCNIGSVNLSKHMKNGKLNRTLLKETVTTAIRMLDNTIDINFYPTIEGRTSNMRHRPVGLGVMGFQDALYMADIDFDSNKAVDFSDESMEFISYYAILGSSKLAKERGAYESYKGSKWDRGIFPLDTLDLLEEERQIPIGTSRETRLEWDKVREHVKKYGMRNSNTMAIAPTATISNISGCSPCTEPIYKNLYVKSNMSGEFTVINDYLVNDLQKLGLWTETMIEELKRTDGSVQQITSIPPKLRSKYKEVFEIGPEWLIKIGAARGKWIDQSQSLNIFMEGTSGKRLADVYMLAWHLGLKTTYYLRTMGATSIEKSSIDLAKNVPTPVVAQTETVYQAPIVQEVAEPSSIPVTAIASQPIATSSVSDIVLPPVKQCLIDDPTCESCQ
jgi:ribonucleoside-diphosphate reductase alpha chain